MWLRVSYSFRSVASSTLSTSVSYEKYTLGLNRIFNVNLRFLAQDSRNIDIHNDTHSGATAKPRSDTKVLKVAFIGRPNAGKSTLINQIVGRTMCPVSMKAHTTRVKLRAFTNDGDSQLVFLDTPGLVFVEEVKKFKFEPVFLRSAEEAVNEADIIGVLHDASLSMCNSLDPSTVRLLLLYKQKRSFLVVNKVDAIKKHRLLKLTETLTKQPKCSMDSKEITEQEISELSKMITSWPHFDEVFMISALEGDGVGDVKEYLLQEAHPGPWLVKKNVVSNRDSLAVDFVKAACLDFLPEEVPYKLKYKLLYFEDDGDTCAVEVAVTPGNKRHQRMLLDKIRPIAGYAEANLASAMEKECRLRVQVQVIGEK